MDNNQWQYHHNMTLFVKYCSTLFMVYFTDCYTLSLPYTPMEEHDIILDETN